MLQGDQQVKHVVQTADQLHQNGDQMTLQESLADGTLAPGKYRIEIKATDAIANQTVSKETDFTVTSAPGNAAMQASQTSPPR